MEEGQYKIFVGNVPYQCTKEEFEECFKHFKGYVTSEVIGSKNSPSDVSKGFGYVIFKNYENAHNIMQKKIILKNRVLRLTKYDEEQRYKSDTNQVFINGLPNGITKSKLVDILSACGKIKECNIYRNGLKLNGIVTFSSEEGYMAAVKNDIYLGEETINILPFKRKRNFKPFVRDDDSLYQAGYNAGRIVGFQEGFQQGMKYLDTDL